NDREDQGIGGDQPNPLPLGGPVFRLNPLIPTVPAPRPVPILGQPERHAPDQRRSQAEENPAPGVDRHIRTHRSGSAALPQSSEMTAVHSMPATKSAQPANPAQPAEPT